MFHNAYVIVKRIEIDGNFVDVNEVCLDKRRAESKLKAYKEKGDGIYFVIKRPLDRVEFCNCERCCGEKE